MICKLHRNGKRPSKQKNGPFSCTYFFSMPRTKVYCYENFLKRVMSICVCTKFSIFYMMKNDFSLSPISACPSFGISGLTMPYRAFALRFCMRGTSNDTQCIRSNFWLVLFLRETSGQLGEIMRRRSAHCFASSSR